MLHGNRKHRRNLPNRCADDDAKTPLFHMKSVGLQTLEERQHKHHDSLDAQETKEDEERFYLEPLVGFGDVVFNLLPTNFLVEALWFLAVVCLRYFA